MPLGTDALSAFLDFVFLDKLSIDAITDPEDILDLIRFCGAHMPKFRSELLAHFCEQLNLKNCVKFLSLAFEMSRDPASAKEINRALNYLKYFFVSHWEKIIFDIEVDGIQKDLLIDLMRLKSKGHDPELEQLKNSIKVPFLPPSPPPPPPPPPLLPSSPPPLYLLSLLFFTLSHIRW